MMRCRSRLFLLGVVASLTACATARMPEERPPPGSTRTPPPPLVPHPEGTPLPPRDTGIADRWPPEIKRLVDNMLTLFPKTPDERPPTVKEVEQKMGITLTERPLRPDEALSYSKKFVVGATRYMNPPTDVPESFGARYTILRESQTKILKLVVSPIRSGFCLDPYELAVYTGETFTNSDTSPHANLRSWPPAYVWGMFRWSNSGRYGARTFTITVGQDRDPTTRQIINDGCVADIAVAGGGGYRKERQASERLKS